MKPIFWLKTELPKIQTVFLRPLSNCFLNSSRLGRLFQCSTNDFMSFLLYCDAQNSTQYFRWGCTRAEQSGTIFTFGWLAILLLMHPRAQLALLAVCWLIANLPSSGTILWKPILKAVLKSKKVASTGFTWLGGFV